MDPSFRKSGLSDDSRSPSRQWNRRNSRQGSSDNARPSTPKSPGKPRNSKSLIEVPVEFVDSSKPDNSKAKAKKNPWRPPQMSEPTAAVKIQKAFRGFSVRKTEPLKNLKAIARLKAEVEEIRQRINDQGFVELIRWNEKERLKITEGLMSLLLKLDAIQGVNTLVRESRKAVIRELVKLQETIDAIVAEKLVEAKPKATIEESALPDTAGSPEEHVAMDFQAVQSNGASSPPDTALPDTARYPEENVAMDFQAAQSDNAASSPDIALPEKESSPEENVAMDVQAAESDAVSSPGNNLNSLENAPEENVAMDMQAAESDASSSPGNDLNSLENALEKRIMLPENENELKDVPSENPNLESKVLEPKEFFSPAEDKDTDYSATAKNSSESLKDKDSFEPVKNHSNEVPDISELEGRVPEDKEFVSFDDENTDPLESSKDPPDDVSIVLKNPDLETKASEEKDFISVGENKDFSGSMKDTFEALNEDYADYVSIDKQHESADSPQIDNNRKDTTQMDANDYSEEELEPARKEEILQDAFNELDQIKTWIEGRAQKDSFLPANDANGLEDNGEDKMEENIEAGKNRDTTYSMECSEEGAMASENTSKLQKDKTLQADSEVGVGKCEGTGSDWEFLEKPEDEDDSRNESRRTVENVREANMKLKAVIEDLYQQKQIQNDMLASISKKLEQLEKRMLLLNSNRRKSAKGKRKRSVDRVQ